MNKRNNDKYYTLQLYDIPKMSIVQLLLSLLLIASLRSQSDCDGVRYTENVFTQVNVASNILYGGNYNPNIWGQNLWEELYLNIYEPVGDYVEDRPLVFFLFGGSFIAGSKNSPDIVALANVTG